jgi:murein DD-endopeptidase MepM/ murein hydrolase activator NlpD
MPNFIQEPPIDPMADTNPSLTIRKVDLEQGARTSGWRRAIGFFSLIGAAALTIATVLVWIAPTPPPVVTVTAENQQPTAVVMQPTVMPTEQVFPTVPPEAINAPDTIPTLNPQQITRLLEDPPSAAQPVNPLAIERDNLNPFTFVRQDRPRSEVIQYTAVDGDTINSIAARFGLEPESIAWSNSRRIVQVLRPGDDVNIPPVNGVYVQIVGSQNIQEIAAQYQITDPYIVIDSEFNTLEGSTPETVPPSGSYVFIPGGSGEDVTWNPGVTTEERNGQVVVTSFAPGDPGSCGNVSPGGGSAWVNPLPGGTFVRGFSSFHTGIDLSAAVGTPVRAANSGSVIFAGWNSWGYGNTVVLAHGPFLTLYGHMSSIAVGCGQIVGAGQTIGAVGSTGNSSGPHLHFEIRNGQTPTDPTATLGGLGG